MMDRTRFPELRPGRNVSAEVCQALIARGKAASRRGKKAEARYFFRMALEVTPDHPDGLLWLAYLEGGGRPSLVYLVRLLEADPKNARARAAIRWARRRARPVAATTVVPPVSRWKRERSLRVGLIGAALALLTLMVGLTGAASVLQRPTPAPIWVQEVAVVPSVIPSLTATVKPSPAPSLTASPLPSETASPFPTQTASPSPRPTASLTPRPTTDSRTVRFRKTPSAMITPRAFPTSERSALRSAVATDVPSALQPTASGNAPKSILSDPTAVPTSIATAAPLPTTAIGDNFRWIDVDLTKQQLVAYEGETPVRTVSVSTGLPGTPTVTGRFQIYVKYPAAGMSGPGYDLPNVPYVMYFYYDYGLHGTYWHNNFGHPMSHGCVNLPTPEAEWLYNWASVGTLVVVHY